MSYMKLYQVKNLGAKFKFGIKRDREKSETGVLRVNPDIENWDIGHVCQRHYALYSPDKLYRSILTVKETMSENELRSLAVEYTVEAINQINRMAMISD